MKIISVYAMLFRADGEMHLRTHTDKTNVTVTFRRFDNVAQNCQYKENQTSLY
jgi:hypothetical protein